MTLLGHSLHLCLVFLCRHTMHARLIIIILQTFMLVFTTSSSFLLRNIFRENGLIQTYLVVQKKHPLSSKGSSAWTIAGFCHKYILHNFERIFSIETHINYVINFQSNDFRKKSRVLIRVKINAQAINCHKSQLQFTTQLFCELKSLKHKHIIHLEKIGVTKGGKTQKEDVKSIVVQSQLYLSYLF